MSDASQLSREGAEVLGHVAGLARGGHPLAAGLRAAAAEASPRVANGLVVLAEQLEQGRSLEDACLDPSLKMPNYVRGLVLAATRTGQLGPALDELLQHQSTIRLMYWRTWSSLAYPLLVLLLNFGILGFVLVWVVPEFKQMFVEFDLLLPSMTMTVLSTSDLILWFVSGPGRPAFFVFALGAALFLYLAASGRGGAALQRLLIEPMPIVGVLWLWSGTAAFFHMLATLIDKDVPLTEALDLASEATRKADVRHAGRWLAGQVAAGQSLADAVENSRCFPASAVPLLRWGERMNSLPDAARTVGDMFAERVSMRTDWLRSVSPPFVYVCVGITVGAVVISLFLPLINLLQML